MTASAICTEASDNAFYPDEEGVTPDTSTPKLLASGEFGNAKFTLQANMDDGEFIDVEGGVLTTPRIFGLNLSPSMKIRFKATDCDANTSVTITIE